MSDEEFYTIDIGCNFATKHYNPTKVQSILEDSFQRGVDKVISISNASYEIPKNQELANLISNKNSTSKEQKCCSFYFTAGVHPHTAKEVKSIEELDVIKQYATDNHLVAVGEIGLDYNRMFSPKEKQIEVFSKQIDIAKELDLPIYLHCRDAFDDFYQIIKEKGHKKAVSHCFTGNKQEAEKLLELDFFFGITGWLCDKRRNQDLIEAVKVIPIERLMVETDCPFLSVDRKRDAMPYDTGRIVEEIAKIKNMDVLKCGKQIYQNTISFFKFK